MYGWGGTKRGGNQPQSEDAVNELLQQIVEGNPSLAAVELVGSEHDPQPVDPVVISSVLLAVESSSVVKSLVLKRRTDGPEIVTSLTALVARSKSLLTMRISDISFGNELTMPLFGALIKNPSLTSVTLSRTGLTDTQGLVLCLAKNTTLQTVDLSFNPFGENEKAVTHFVEGLRTVNSPRLQELRLIQCKLHDGAVNAICDVLEESPTEHCPALITLSVNGERDITSMTMQRLRETLDARRSSALAAAKQQRAPAAVTAAEVSSPRSDEGPGIGSARSNTSDDGGLAKSNSGTSTGSNGSAAETPSSSKGNTAVAATAAGGAPADQAEVLALRRHVKSLVAEAEALRGRLARLQGTAAEVAIVRQTVTAAGEAQAKLRDQLAAAEEARLAQEARHRVEMEESRHWCESIEAENTALREEYIREIREAVSAASNSANALRNGNSNGSSSNGVDVGGYASHLPEVYSANHCVDAVVQTDPPLRPKGLTRQRWNTVRVNGSVDRGPLSTNTSMAGSRRPSQIATSEASANNSSRSRSESTTNRDMANDYRRGPTLGEEA